MRAKRARCAQNQNFRNQAYRQVVKQGRRGGSGGDGGIRTLDRALRPYNGLANRRLQPLGHISAARRERRAADICPTAPVIASLHEGLVNDPASLASGSGDIPR